MKKNDEGVPLYREHDFGVRPEPGWQPAKDHNFGLPCPPEVILGNSELLLRSGDLLFEPLGILRITRCRL